jgi:hypothetical protein
MADVYDLPEYRTIADITADAIKDAFGVNLNDDERARIVTALFEIVPAADRRERNEKKASSSD